MPEQDVQNQDPSQVSDFVTVQGAPPAASPAPAQDKPFGGDFDKLANAYQEIRTAYSGDLGTVKNKLTSFEQKMSQLDQISQTLAALQQNFKPAAPAPAVETGQAPPADNLEIPYDALYDAGKLRDSIDKIVSTRISAAQKPNPQFEALLQKFEAVQQNFDPQKLDERLNTMMEDRLARMALDQEKAMLLKDYNAEVVDLAGYLAYKNNKSSYLEGLELVKQKYPNLIAPQLPNRPELPVDMLSSASSVDNGVNALHRQFDQVTSLRSPSQILMGIK